jgi:hypothetical protein
MAKVISIPTARGSTSVENNVFGGSADNNPRNPSAGPTELGVLVRDRYNAAALYRNQSTSGPRDRSAQTDMEECRRLVRGILTPEQHKLAEDVAGVKLNIVDAKATVAEAWIKDVVEANINNLLTVEPTPQPELSKSAKREVVESIKEDLAKRLRDSGYPIDAPMDAMPSSTQKELSAWLTNQVQELKSVVKAREKELVTQASREMELLISDQLIETGFKSEFSDFVSDFLRLPFAVVRVPSVEMLPDSEWNGDKWVEKTAKKVAFRRVSPWNFYVSPDSSTAQNGSYVAERIPTRKDQLMRMAKLPNWIQENVVAALMDFSTGRVNLDWLSPNPDTKGANLGWPTHHTVDRLVVHGIFSGRELEKYNIGAGIGRTEFVEACVTILGTHVLQARLGAVRAANFRPYHATSFRKETDYFYGTGLPNKLADIQVSVYAAFWAMMRNASYSAGARGEVDIDRIKQFIKEDSTPENVLAAQFHFVGPDNSRTQGGQSAFKFHNIPNYVAQFSSLIDDLLRKADLESGIPSIASGDLQYSTAGRSARGILALYGAATKTMKILFNQIDEDIFGPAGMSLYKYNIQDQPKKFLNLDAEVKARGTASLMEQELKKGAAIESLQAAPALVQLAQTGGADLPPGLIKDILVNAAEGLGIDTSGYPELRSKLEPTKTPPVADSVIPLQQVRLP